jgi:hypothetical protein
LLLLFPGKLPGSDREMAPQADSILERGLMPRALAAPAQQRLDVLLPSLTPQEPGDPIESFAKEMGLAASALSGFVHKMGSLKAHGRKGFCAG